MLTPKQNMLEVIKGGNPDRFVNQYEAVQLLFHPFMFTNPLLQPGQENVVNAWGVTNTFPKGVPGSFPVHTPDKIVVKDIEDWMTCFPGTKLAGVIYGTGILSPGAVKSQRKLLDDATQMGQSI